MNLLSNTWRWLNGKKIWIAVGGYLVEIALALTDQPQLVDTLFPEEARPYVNGGLGVLLATGLLHRAEKQRIQREK